MVKKQPHKPKRFVELKELLAKQPVQKNAKKYAESVTLSVEEFRKDLVTAFLKGARHNFSTFGMVVLDELKNPSDEILDLAWKNYRELEKYTLES